MEKLWYIIVLYRGFYLPINSIYQFLQLHWNVRHWVAPKAKVLCVIISVAKDCEFNPRLGLHECNPFIHSPNLQSSLVLSQRFWQWTSSGPGALQNFQCNISSLTSSLPQLLEKFLLVLIFWQRMPWWLWFMSQEFVSWLLQHSLSWRSLGSCS